MKKIMIIEDEKPIAMVLSAYLTREGYALRHNDGTGDPVREFIEFAPDLCLLDLTLPDFEGLDLLEQFRAINSCPIIILTARDALPDRIHGLRQGADDYIPKPFHMEEVLARIEAVLRRELGTKQHNRVQFGALTIDFDAATAAVGGRRIELIPRDYQLLAFLARNPGQCFTREGLLDRIWGMDYDGSDRAVDTAIKRLRRQLADWPQSEGQIQTVRGMGYRLYVG